MNYTIGIDFGTLSARAVLVDEVGNIIAESTDEYTHGIMRKVGGVSLPNNYAIQHPDDYVESLRIVVKGVLDISKVDVDKVVGIGIDFTSSTILPVDESDLPLCKTYPNNPHAYVKLWKHHGAEKIALKMQKLASKGSEPWLSRYGGKLSCELALPKIVETLLFAPEVYDATSRFVEAGDWIVSMLTSKKVHSAIFSGYKWCYTNGSYPSNEYFKKLDLRLDGVVGTKIPSDVVDSASVGKLSKFGAELTGLREGTKVAIPIIDAHAGLPAMGAVDEGDMMLIIGTSGCQIVNSKRSEDIEGIFGYVDGSIIPSLFTYEAGQTAVGDIFDWVVKNCVSADYVENARKEGINLHKYLREKAKNLKIGESGLIALDWLNGNRSILNDSSLKGAIFGLTLDTKPEEIYRAFIEATAFGVKVIVDTFKSHGVSIKKIVAGGGLMQIYSDVLDTPIIVPDCSQAGALGSAILGAVAGGVYPDIVTASKKMGKHDGTIYTPIRDNVLAYESLYKKYKTLHDVFGKREQ